MDSTVLVKPLIDIKKLFPAEFIKALNGKKWDKICYVSGSYNEVNDGVSPDTSYDNMAEAIEMAEAGDIIEVQNDMQISGETLDLNGATVRLNGRDIIIVGCSISNGQIIQAPGLDNIIRNCNLNSCMFFQEN